MGDFACSVNSTAFDVRESVEVMSLVLGIKELMEFERRGPDCCMESECVLNKHLQCRPFLHLLLKALTTEGRFYLQREIPPRRRVDIPP